MRRLVRKVLGRLLNSKMQAAWRTWLKRLELLRWEDQMASLSGDEQQAMRDRAFPFKRVTNVCLSSGEDLARTCLFNKNKK